MAATTSQSHLLRPTLPSLRLRCPSSLHSVSLRRTNGTDRISSLRAVSKPTILVAEKLGAAGLELLKEFGNVDCSYNMSPEELCAKVPLCDALIVRSGTKARMWQRDVRDRTVIQPTPAAALDMLPTAAYADNPSTSFAAKFVHASTNKNRCSINRVVVIRHEPIYVLF